MEFSGGHSSPGRCGSPEIKPTLGCSESQVQGICPEGGPPKHSQGTWRGLPCVPHQHAASTTPFHGAFLPEPPSLKPAFAVSENSILLSHGHKPGAREKVRIVCSFCIVVHLFNFSIRSSFSVRFFLVSFLPQLFPSVWIPNHREADLLLLTDLPSPLKE